MEQQCDKSAQVRHDGSHAAAIYRVTVPLSRLSQTWNANSGEGEDLVHPQQLLCSPARIKAV